jgi:catechol 2,3-dioxygenase-like lactoylglutathione lyase family enzyme
VLDHIVISIRDLDGSRAFYEQALRPLGLAPILDFPGTTGFGADGKPEFWIREADDTEPAHIAFRAPDRPTVDGFYAAALGAGGTDNGGPGLREIYHPDYYGAFVLDPDGHNIEAVFHGPSPAGED